MTDMETTIFLNSIAALTVLAYASLRWGADTTDGIEGPDWAHRNPFEPRDCSPDAA
jgi:hypothetical protein